MKSRVLCFLAWTIIASLTTWLYTKTIDVPVSNEAALANVNGGSVEFAAQNTLESARTNAYDIGLLLWSLVSLIILLPGKNGVIAAVKKLSGTTATAVLLLLLAIPMTGCMRPYDTPEYKEIQTFQTAYVIDMDTTKASDPKQVKFDSEEFLEKSKIATKRIQIPHRWVQDGRIIGDGHYIPTIMLVIVDRSPVTREWTSKEKGEKGADQAIWTESADSVGFSMGWNVTGYIQEKDTSKFLYVYPSASLSTVIDTEVRSRVQMIAAQESAKYKLDSLRERKNEIADAVRKDCTEFFSARGITLTSIGQFGGMSYENPKIQDAIDQTFITQQEKVNARSMLEAQDDKNKRITSEADALAEASRRKAKGEADGLESINKALEKAANNPQLLQLRSLEVEKNRIEKWKGDYPQVVAGSGANAWIGLGNVPVDQPVKAVK
jgi:hypothetical protein